jgi:hypothetical protein
MPNIPSLVVKLPEGWTQPHKDEIHLTEFTAVMSQTSFNKLIEFDPTQAPDNLVGCMWKASSNGSTEYSLLWFNWDLKYSFRDIVIKGK